jgi:hypothetical protein
VHETAGPHGSSNSSYQSSQYLSSQAHPHFRPRIAQADAVHTFEAWLTQLPAEWQLLMNPSLGGPWRQPLLGLVIPEGINLIELMEQGIDLKQDWPERGHLTKPCLIHVHVFFRRGASPFFAVSL